MSPRTVRIVGLFILATILGFCAWNHQSAMELQSELEGTFGNELHDTYYLVPNPIVIILGSLGLLLGLFAILRPSKVCLCRVFENRSAIVK